MDRISLKLFIKDKIILILISLNLLAVLSLFFYLFFSFKNFSSPTVFLHYTVHLGVDLIGTKAQIYSLPLGGFLVVLFNSFLSYLLYLNQKDLSRLMMFVTLIIQFLLWISGIFLVFINV
ncbi:MAG TPA: hypothetical protein PKY08_00060 [Candidatus Magasanikbacteria bacterium]|nr:hypothetical protein [Candidatus Magasanikbacteria bacterium]